MGFKSALKKIGKIALTAAPYVAAPFTGGASLALTGVANKAVQKWSEHDAKNAVAKGLAPSKFDSILGKVGGYAGLASSFIPTNALGSIGMLGSAGKAASAASKAGQVANAVSKTSKVADVLGKVGKVASIAGPAIGGAMAIKNAIGNNGSSEGRGIGPSDSVVGSAVPRGNGGMNSGPGFARYQQDMDLNNPNLANSIAAGRNAAVRDQGFRKGYDVTTRVGEPDEEGKYATVTQQMPRIKSDFAIGGTASRRNRKAS